MNPNKKLLTVAVAGALVAPSAGLAQGGPTIYGQAHISVDWLQNEIDDSLNTSSNTSRIGVKGSYDLGGGLDAIYKFEWGVRATDRSGDGSALSRRNQYAGLKSDTFGTVLAGRHDTPVKIIGRKVDLFWSTQLGQNRSITAQSDGGLGFDQRLDNFIGYISPNLGPVHVFVSYITDTNSRSDDDDNFTISDNNNYDAFSASLSYDQKSLFTGDDKLYIGVGWEQHRLDDASKTENSGRLNGADRIINHGQESAIRAGIRYDIGNWAVVGFYQGGKNLGFSKGADRDLFGGGLQYKWNDWVFKGTVYSAGKFKSRNNTDALHFAGGFDYYFSKQVQLYFQGTGLSQGDRAGLNEDQTSNNNPGFTLGGRGHGDSMECISDETCWGLSGGIRILF